MAAETYIFLDNTPIHDVLEKASESMLKMAAESGMNVTETGFWGWGLDPSPILHAALASFILMGLGVLLRRSPREPGIYPEKKTFTVHNVVELIITGLINFMKEYMGDKASKFVPLVGTTALFILLSNLLGTIPGFEPPTTNFNTTFACGIVVVVATEYIGFRTHGVKYIKHFVGPVWFLYPLMFVLEFVGHMARGVSLSIRLFGNMFGDHLVLGIFMGLIPLLVPVAFMGMAIFVSFLQAFVFTLLTILYISGAVEEAH